MQRSERLAQVAGGSSLSRQSDRFRSRIPRPAELVVLNPSSRRWTECTSDMPWARTSASASNPGVVALRSDINRHARLPRNQERLVTKLGRGSIGADAGRQTTLASYPREKRIHMESLADEKLGQRDGEGVLPAPRQRGCRC